MEGRKLEQILETTGKSCAQIASLLGMTEGQLKGKLGVADVPTGLVENLSAALGLTLDFLFGRDPDWRCSRIVADRGPIELPFTPMELDLPLQDGEKVGYMAAAIIDDHLELDVYSMERLQQFVWPEGKEVVFFVFRSENDCLIRHFNKSHAECSHIFAVEPGFSIGMEALPAPALCLYHDRLKVAAVSLNGFDGFRDALLTIWEECRARLADLRLSDSGK